MTPEEETELLAHPPYDGVTDDQLPGIVMALALHPKAIRKQEMRALCMRLIGSLVWERKKRAAEGRGRTS